MKIDPELDLFQGKMPNSLRFLLFPEIKKIRLALGGAMCAQPGSKKVLGSVLG